jgi:hypothetical protein
MGSIEVSSFKSVFGNFFPAEGITGLKGPDFTPREKLF